MSLQLESLIGEEIALTCENALILVRKEAEATKAIWEEVVGVRTRFHTIAEEQLLHVGVA